MAGVQVTVSVTNPLYLKSTAYSVVIMMKGAINLITFDL